MHTHFHFRVYARYCIVFIGLLVAGCSKNEQAIEQWSFTSLELKAITLDVLRLQVVTDETTLTDSLITPGSKTLPVQYYNPSHRFLVTDLYSNMLLLDTVIDYKPGPNNSITFFQPVNGGKLVWVGPPVNEPLPPAGSIKISIVYAHAKLPDEVKVVVENSKNGGTDYIPTDSFQLKKGAFSPYFIGGNIRKPKLSFYKTTGNKEKVATANSFSFANSDYSIFLFNEDQGVSNGVYELLESKLY